MENPSQADRKLAELQYHLPTCFFLLSKTRRFLSVKKRNLLLVLLCLFFVACSEPFYLYRPFDVSLPEQVLRVTFVVDKTYDYRIALMFDWKNPRDRESRKKQQEIIGSITQSGVKLPLRLIIKKDGTVITDHIIYSDKSSALEGFCYNQNTRQGELPLGFWEAFFFGEIDCKETLSRKNIWGPSRTIDIRTLESGNYYVEVRTVISIQELAGIDAYINISPYSPKI